MGGLVELVEVVEQGHDETGTAPKVVLGEAMPVDLSELEVRP